MAKPIVELAYAANNAAMELRFAAKFIRQVLPNSPSAERMAIKQNLAAERIKNAIEELLAAEDTRGIEAEEPGETGPAKEGP